MRLESVSVCALVYQVDRGRIRYLLLRRTPERGGFWQSVSGHVHAAEPAEDGARREVHEETGFEPVRLIPLDTVNVFFKPGEECIYFEPCFGVEVDRSSPTLSREHDDWRWTDLESALELIPFGGVRDALRELHGRLVVEPAPDD